MNVVDHVTPASNYGVTSALPNRVLQRVRLFFSLLFLSSLGFGLRFGFLSRLFFDVLSCVLSGDVFGIRFGIALFILFGDLAAIRFGVLSGLVFVSIFGILRGGGIASLFTMFFEGGFASLFGILPKDFFAIRVYILCHTFFGPGFGILFVILLFIRFREFFVLLCLFGHCLLCAQNIVFIIAAIQVLCMLEVCYHSMPQSQKM